MSNENWTDDKRIREHRSCCLVAAAVHDTALLCSPFSPILPSACSNSMVQDYNKWVGLHLIATGRADRDTEEKSEEGKSGRSRRRAWYRGSCGALGSHTWANTAQKRGSGGTGRRNLAGGGWGENWGTTGARGGRFVRGARGHTQPAGGHLGTCPAAASQASRWVLVYRRGGVGGVRCGRWVTEKQSAG